MCGEREGVLKRIVCCNRYGVLVFICYFSWKCVYSLIIFSRLPRLFRHERLFYFVSLLLHLSFSVLLSHSTNSTIPPPRPFFLLGTFIELVGVAGIPTNITPMKCSSLGSAFTRSRSKEGEIPMAPVILIVCERGER